MVKKYTQRKKKTNDSMIIRFGSHGTVQMNADESSVRAAVVEETDDLKQH